MKLQELMKMKKKLKMHYLTCCNLLIVQDLLQTHYQVLLIIFLEGFMKIKLNLNTTTMIGTFRIKYKD